MSKFHRLTAFVLLASLFTTGCGDPATDGSDGSGSQPAPSRNGSGASGSDASSARTSGAGTAVDRAAPTAVSQPAVKNSFTEITSQLDAGGQLYFYLSTEHALAKLTDAINDLHKMLSPYEEKAGEPMGIFFKTLNTIVAESGLVEISGLGASSFAISDVLYRNRVVLHHYQDDGGGKLWQMFGSEPKPLEMLDLLPANTAIAYYADVDVELAWKWIGSTVMSTGVQEIQQQWGRMEEGLDDRGVDINALLGSLDNSFGIAVTLDHDEKVLVPVEDVNLMIPEPAMFAVLTVKDDTLFNMLEESFAEADVGLETRDNGGLRMRVMGQKIPVPFALQPAFARSGDYLFLASTPQAIERALAVKGGAPGLKSTDNFKKLAVDIPETGNQFHYVSPGLAPVIEDLYRRIVEEAGEPGFDTLVDLMHFEEFLHGYGVMQVTGEGMVLSANSNHMAVSATVLHFLGPAIIISSAILPPMLTKARQNSLETISESQLKQIGLGLIMYAGDDIEEGKLPEKDNAAGLNELIANSYLMNGAYVNPRSKRHKPGKENEPLTEKTCSYIYFGGLRDVNRYPTVSPLVFDKPGVPGNTRVLFLDGHVESLQGSFDSCEAVIKALDNDRLPKKHKQWYLDKAKAMDERRDKLEY
ncbi:MAG: hypothetical protein QGF67_03290 [Lentisphaeria bacterium]|jgi:hypothetical protein|nr:hypothetical protein [Lentisphaeria bacterium]